MVLKFRTFPDGGRGVVCKSSDVRKFLKKSKFQNFSLKLKLEIIIDRDSNMRAFTYGAVYKGRPPKSRVFKPPLPLSGCVRISKTTPPPRTSASGFFNFTHFSIFTHFYFCSLKQSLLPNSCFYKV